MSVKIETLGVVVPGQVTRKYDQATGETTLTISADQARHLFGSLETVLMFFNMQEDEGLPPTPEGLSSGETGALHQFISGPNGERSLVSVNVDGKDVTGIMEKGTTEE